MSKASKKKARLMAIAERQNEFRLKDVNPMAKIQEKFINNYQDVLFDPIFKKFMFSDDLNLLPPHEAAHKIIWDSFFGETDPGKYIYDDNGRPMVSSDAMRNCTASFDFNSYGKTLVAGYIGELLALGVDYDNVIRYMEAYISTIFIGFGNGARPDPTKDDTKYFVYFHQKKIHSVTCPDDLDHLFDPEGLWNQWNEDVKWVYNYLKNHWSEYQTEIENYKTNMKN